MKGSTWLPALTILAVACSMPPLLGGQIRSAHVVDGEFAGTYKDFPNTVDVRVVVAGGKIVECEVTDTKGVFKRTGAETTIPKRIIENQSTEVDAVSGATNLSRVIMNAVQDALDKSELEDAAVD